MKTKESDFKTSHDSRKPYLNFPNEIIPFITFICGLNTRGRSFGLTTRLFLLLLGWNCCTPLFATKMHPTASRTTGCTLSLSLTHTHTLTHTNTPTHTHTHTHTLAYTHIHSLAHSLTHYLHLSLSLMLLGLLGTKYGWKEHNHQQPFLLSSFFAFFPLV